MTGTWNGIGTKFYGCQDQYPDESFITTEWFVTLFFPILPIASYRVIYRDTLHGWGKSTSRYIIIEKLRLDWRQVFSTYFVAISTVIVAILTGWLVNSLFVDKEWGSFAVIFSSMIPILISIKLFFEAKPSSNSHRRTPQKSGRSISNFSRKTESSTPQETIYPFSKVDISKFPMPNISPPTVLSDLDMKPLEPIIEKYGPHLLRIMEDPNAKPPEWVTIKLALDDTMLLNFQSISHYMINAVFDNNYDKKKELDELVKKSTILASSYAWMVGKEWGQSYPSIKAKFQNNVAIQLADVPSDALQLLLIAVYFPYYLFANIFSDYYDSDYGKNVKSQKDGHLINTYQGMMKGMLACFLMGLQSP